MTDDELFALFWHNTSLGPHTSRVYGQRLADDARTPAPESRLYYGTSDLALPQRDDALSALMARRASGREFGDSALTVAQLGALFGAFRALDDGRRTAPSAGARYPVEVFAWLYRVEGALTQKAVYYNTDLHSLSVVGEAPAWPEARETLNWSGESTPGAVFVFTAFASRAMNRYGARGARFVLMEVGHYAQNLGLRVTQESLVGAEVGGLQDASTLRALGLGDTEAIAPLAYVCGAAMLQRVGGERG